MKTGEEVTEPKKIFKHYTLSGTFGIDLLASVPTDFLTDVVFQESANSGVRTFLQLLGLLKLIRIRRLSKIIMFMRARDQVKMTLKLLQLLLFLVMYIHVVACLWYIVVSWDEEWVPPTDFIYYGTQLYSDESDLWWKYWICFYTSIFLLIGGEIAPRNTTNGAFSSIMILVGAVITSIMFGEMAVLMTNMSRNASRFQNLQDSINTTMRNMGMPKPLQQKIYEYLIYTQGMLDQRNEYESLEKLLSPSLQKEVHLFIYDRIVSQNTVFCRAQPMHDYIVHNLRNRLTRPEEEIVQFGTKGRQMFFVANGECEVYVPDLEGDERLVALIKPGGHFGELALLYQRLRTATVRSMNYCGIGVLDQENFYEFINKFPSTMRLIKQGTMAYKDPLKVLLAQMMKRVPYFKHLDDEILDEVFYSMDPIYIEAEQHLFTPGKAVSDIIFLTKGFVEVSYTLNEKNIHSYKRRSKFQDIEDFDQNQRIPKYDPMFKLTKRFKRYSVNLKRKAEVVPQLGMMGVIGSVFTKETSKVPMAYPQEIIIRRVGPGTILNSIEILAPETLQYQAKTLTPVAMFKMSRNMLMKFSDKNGYETLKSSLTQANQQYIARNPTEFKRVVVDYNTLYEDEEQAGYWVDLFKRNVFKVVAQNRLNKILNQGIYQLLYGNQPIKSENYNLV